MPPGVGPRQARLQSRPPPWQPRENGAPIAFRGSACEWTIIPAEASLPADEFLDFILENLERYRAGKEHGVVKRALGKPVLQLRLRAVAQLENLQLPDHVGGRLTREDDVALDLARFDAVVNRLLASPSFGM